MNKVGIRIDIDEEGGAVEDRKVSQAKMPTTVWKRKEEIHQF